MHEQRPRMSRPKAVKLICSYAVCLSGWHKASLLRFRVRPKEEMAEFKDSHTLGLGSLGNEGSDYETTTYFDTGGHEAASRPSFLERDGRETKEGEDDKKCSCNKITACDSEGRIC